MGSSLLIIACLKKIYINKIYKINSTKIILRSFCPYLHTLTVETSFETSAPYVQQLILDIKFAGIPSYVGKQGM